MLESRYNEKLSSVNELLESHVSLLFLLQEKNQDEFSNFFIALDFKTKSLITLTFLSALMREKKCITFPHTHANMHNHC